MFKKVLSVLVIIAIPVTLGTAVYLCDVEVPAPTPTIEVQESFPDLIQRLMPGVVHIVSETGQWQGSGFFITNDIICTARHVVSNTVDFTITLNDGTELKAHKALQMKNYDVGFILLDKPCEKARILPIGPIADCRLGEEVFAIGNPFGLVNHNSVTKGIISGLNREMNEGDDSYGWSVAFTTDAAGHPGNSGCPVFSVDGVVRGVLVGGYSPVLIICMPCELFQDDGAVVRMIFEMQRYVVVSYYPQAYDEIFVDEVDRCH